MTTLAQYDRARAALAEATRIDEVLPIRDEIEHIKLYARQINDEALLADASAFQMRIERKLGFIISEAKKAGHFKEGRPKKNSTANGQLSVTLDDVGVDRKLSSRAQKRSSISEQAFELCVQGVRDRIAARGAKIIDNHEINGARALMGSRHEPDDSLDYFPTPPWATRALMQHVLPTCGFMGKRIKTAWEPACGEGHIAEVLREYSDSVYATDIHDYGYNDSVADFLRPEISCDVDWIVTNPPFGDKAEAFVLRAIDMANVGVAMFFRLQWIPTAGRYNRIFGPKPPTLVAFFSERVPLVKGRWDPTASTATDYVWLVWVKGKSPMPPLWIPPGQREALSEPDDVERFTARPVKRRSSLTESIPPHDPVTGEIKESGVVA
jgi:hypothetical protein